MGNIFLQYFEWHFADRPRNIFDGWLSCLKFNLNYWSVPMLVKTYFSHWRRYRYSYGKGLNLKRYFEAFSSNMISRAIGVVMRTFLILAGLATEVLIFGIGILALVLWLALPVIIILGMIYGFKILF